MLFQLGRLLWLYPSDFVYGNTDNFEYFPVVWSRDDLVAWSRAYSEVQNVLPAAMSMGTIRPGRDRMTWRVVSGLQSRAADAVFEAGLDIVDKDMLMERIRQPFTCYCWG